MVPNAPLGTPPEPPSLPPAKRAIRFIRSLRQPRAAQPAGPVAVTRFRRAVCVTPLNSPPYCPPCHPRPLQRPSHTHSALRIARSATRAALHVPLLSPPPLSVALPFDATTGGMMFKARLL
eukprot:8241346-Pyramimonas_sp.AAC.1